MTANHPGSTQATTIPTYGEDFLSSLGESVPSLVSNNTTENNSKSIPIMQVSAFASASLASLGKTHQSDDDGSALLKDSSDDFDFFEYLHHLFANEATSEAVAPLVMNANLQYLMNPKVWLSTKSLPCSSEPTAAQLAEPNVLSSENESNEPECSFNHLQSAVVNSHVVQAATGKATPVVSLKVGDESSQITAPFDFFKDMMAHRGYSFETAKSVEMGYLAAPSPLQLASFGTKLVDAVHTSDVLLLSSLLDCGLSPNPCSQFHDLPLAWACKKGQDSIFQCFLDHKADIRVCDDFGRTPLHHTAWSDIFSPFIAQSILQRDPVQLFLEDNIGRTPLEYIPAKVRTQWIAFLDLHKDELFPAKGAVFAVTKKHGSGQMPDLPNAISVHLARLVSSGQLQPEQVLELDKGTRKMWTQPS